MVEPRGTLRAPVPTALLQVLLTVRARPWASPGCPALLVMFHVKHQAAHTMSPRSTSRMPPVIGHPPALRLCQAGYPRSSSLPRCLPVRRGTYPLPRLRHRLKLRQGSPPLAPTPRRRRHQCRRRWSNPIPDTVLPRVRSPWKVTRRIRHWQWKLCGPCRF